MGSIYHYRDQIICNRNELVFAVFIARIPEECHLSLKEESATVHLLSTPKDVLGFFVCEKQDPQDIGIKLSHLNNIKINVVDGLKDLGPQDYDYLIIDINKKYVKNLHAGKSPYNSLLLAYQYGQFFAQSPCCYTARFENDKLNKKDLSASLHKKTKSSFFRSWRRCTLTKEEDLLDPITIVTGFKV